MQSQTEVIETAAWFECGWGEYDHRLSGLLWEAKPPEDYLRKVAYVRKRRDIAAKREDEQRKANGKEPMWNLSLEQQVLENRK